MTNRATYRHHPLRLFASRANVQALAYEVGERVIVRFRFRGVPGIITGNQDSSTYSVRLDRALDGETDFTVIRYCVTTEAEILKRQGARPVASERGGNNVI